MPERILMSLTPCPQPQKVANPEERRLRRLAGPAVVAAQVSAPRRGLGVTIVNSMSTADFLFCAASVSASREVGDDDEAIGCDGRVAPTVDRDGVCNCDFVGKRFPGAVKYLGGVRGSTGVIYAIPGHAKRVLQIDGDDVRLVGPVFEGKYKWLRGVAARGRPCRHQSGLRTRRLGTCCTA